MKGPERKAHKVAQHFLDADDLESEDDVQPDGALNSCRSSRMKSWMRTTRYAAIVLPFIGSLVLVAFTFHWHLKARALGRKASSNDDFVSKVGMSTTSNFNVALGIGSAGAGTGGAAKSTAKNTAESHMGLLSTARDLHDFNTWCYSHDWYVYGTINYEGEAGKAQHALASIKDFCQQAYANDKRAMIYYTGHGEEGSGDWCFPDNGRIRLRDIMDACSPLPKHGLEIRSDTCFSGQWAYEARRKRYDITVETAAGPQQHARNRIYAQARLSDDGDTSSDDQLADSGALSYANGKVHYLNKDDDFYSGLRNNYFAPDSRYVTAQGFSSDSAFLVMSGMSNFNGQTHTIGTWDDIKRKINKNWDDHYHLTSLQFTGRHNYWSMVMTKGAGIYSETWHWAKTSDELHNCYDDNLHILDVSHGDPGWMIVCGKTDEITAQRWKSTNDYGVIHDFIDKGYDEGYSVTSIAKGGEDQAYYFVVLSKVSTFGAQVVQWDTSDRIKSTIRHQWDSGKTITSVADDYDNDRKKRYWLIMTDVSGSKMFPDSAAFQRYHFGLEI